MYLSFDVPEQERTMQHKENNRRRAEAEIAVSLYVYRIHITLRPSYMFISAQCFIVEEAYKGRQPKKKHSKNKEPTQK